MAIPKMRQAARTRPVLIVHKPKPRLASQDVRTVLPQREQLNPALPRLVLPQVTVKMRHAPQLAPVAPAVPCCRSDCP